MIFEQKISNSSTKDFRLCVDIQKIRIIELYNVNPRYVPKCIS